MSEPKKVLVIRLFNQGLNIEEIAKKVNCSHKVIEIWTNEFLELKQKRVTELSNVLKYSETSFDLVFSKDEILTINEEITNILSNKADVFFVFDDQKIKVGFFEYNKILLDKINLVLSKI